MNNENTNVKPKRTAKQIGALLVVAILIILYIATLLLAIFDSTSSGMMFQACLFATIGLPILLWIYIGIYGYYSKKHTIADMDILKKANLPDDDVSDDNATS